jgi:hypothetical protein
VRDLRALSIVLHSPGRPRCVWSPCPLILSSYAPDLEGRVLFEAPPWNSGLVTVAVASAGPTQAVRWNHWNTGRLHPLHFPNSSDRRFLLRLKDFALAHIMPLRSPPDTQTEGHNRPRSSSVVSGSHKTGSTNARKRPLSLVAASRPPLAERSPNATPVPTTPTYATINKRPTSLLPSLPGNRRVSAPIVFNSEKPPLLPPQTRAAAARESFPSRPSAPVPESTASSVVGSIRSMKKQTDQDDTSSAAPRRPLPPTEPLAMSTITAFHDPPTATRRGPLGTPRRAISMAVRSPGQRSERESGVSGPSRRPGLHPQQTLQRPFSYQVPAKTPPRLASTTRSPLAPSPRSQADSSRSDTTDGSVISAMHFMADPNMPQSNAPSVWEGDGGDASTTFEMETEIAELNDMIDEDVSILIDTSTTSANCILLARSPLLCKVYKSPTRRLLLHTSAS